MPTVKLYAGLQKAAGRKEISLPGPTLRDMLDCLVAQIPSLKELVWDGEALRLHIVITINGKHLPPEQGVDIPVMPEDLVAVFPPIAGGQEPIRKSSLYQVCG